MDHRRACAGRVGSVLRIPAVALVTAAALLAGCSEGAGCVDSSSTADCETVVRYEDTVYVGGGTSSQATEPLGEADLAACADAGGPGSCFPDEPAQVAVGRFPGHDPGHVVGARVNDVTVVLFAEDVPEEVRREITRSGLVEPGTGPYAD
jgi:hypothetical protein